MFYLQAYIEKKVKDNLPFLPLSISLDLLYTVYSTKYLKTAKDA
jgi:hypothetical protein